MGQTLETLKKLNLYDDIFYGKPYIRICLFFSMIGFSGKMSSLNFI